MEDTHHGTYLEDGEGSLDVLTAQGFQTGRLIFKARVTK